MSTFIKTTIVIPTYNEKENVPTLVAQIYANKIDGLDILFVDDNSPDGTADVIRELQTHYPIQLISRAGKMGLGSAYIVGFKRALEQGADYIFEMDADLSHVPADVPRLLQTAMDGADLVIGSRKIPGGGVRGWGWARHFMSNGAMWFSRLVLNLKPRDVTAGFRCFRRQVLESIGLDSIKSNGYAFQEELLYRTQCAGFKIAEVPVWFIDRRNGFSKLSRRDIVEFFIKMISLRLQKTPCSRQ